MSEYNRAPMTKTQVDLARRALGLPNHQHRSYRNSFVGGHGHFNYDDWYMMSQNGYAMRKDGHGLPYGGNDVFRLTLKGAEMVLVGRETLDLEDFSRSLTARKNGEQQ